jgi:hypothetical protein
LSMLDEVRHKSSEAVNYIRCFIPEFVLSH